MTNRTLDMTTSIFASLTRGLAGFTVKGAGARPVQRLELYEFEACPFCRKVREALSELDLDAVIYPCPKGGTRFREDVKRRGGKAQFPFLVDPNAGIEIYESTEIIAHLYRAYGDGRRPPWRPLAVVSGSIASGARVGKGRQVAPHRAPAHLLELWSYEASVHCRPVREVLCELEIPYVLHNVAKKSAQRAAFVERSGKMMVPYLVDPNTGRALFESADILVYLRETYGEPRGR